MTISQFTTPATDTQAPDWIDYGEAEAALFDAIRPELKLIALDHAHHFGAEVAGMADEIAEAAYPKAVAVLQEQGTRRVFSDKHLFRLCQKWAAFWAEHFAQRQRRKAARRRNAADRREYQKQRGARGLRTQGRRADSRALQCQVLKFQGLTASQIATKLGCSVRLVRYDYKRPVDAGLFAEALRPIGGGLQSAKERLIPSSKGIVSTRNSVADCTPAPAAPHIAAAAPEPPPPAARDVDEIAVPSEFLEHWRSTNV